MGAHCHVTSKKGGGGCHSRVRFSGSGFMGSTPCTDGAAACVFYMVSVFGVLFKVVFVRGIGLK